MMNITEYLAYTFKYLSFKYWIVKNPAVKK